MDLMELLFGGRSVRLPPGKPTTVDPAQQLTPPLDETDEIRAARQAKQWDWWDRMVAEAEAKAAGKKGKQ
jgi:hypothetical protein